jgi:hypothetical protein
MYLHISELEKAYKTTYISGFNKLSDLINSLNNCILISK